jgi:hypothetical protein
MALALCTAALFGALLWAAALAQTDDLTTVEPSAYVTLDLQAGFPLDPFLVSLNGGGEVDATTLDEACLGYINDQPVLTANWEGAVDELRIFFYSDSDSTLVVRQPNGAYVCGDDFAENVLDPEVTLTQPLTGTYKVWVGSYDENQLIPGLLVITARPEVGLAMFDPSTLVKRERIEPDIDEEELVETDGVTSTLAKAGITETEAIDADSVITAVSTVTASVVASGTVPTFELGDEETVCGGMVSQIPDYIVEVQEGVPSLRIMFEGDQDSSLVVVSSNGESFCADDSADSTNANPIVDVSEPMAGYYEIHVGRFQEDEPVSGVLTVTTDPGLEPAILAPAATND